MKPKYPLVEVTWIDSALNSGWKTRGTSVTYSQCRTVGYRIPSAKDCVAIAMSVTEDGNFTETMAIPRKAVRLIRKVR